MMEDRPFRNYEDYEKKPISVVKIIAYTCSVIFICAGVYSWFFPKRFINNDIPTIHAEYKQLKVDISEEKEVYGDVDIYKECIEKKSQNTNMMQENIKNNNQDSAIQNANIKPTATNSFEEEWKDIIKTHKSKQNVCSTVGVYVIQLASFYTREKVDLYIKHLEMRNRHIVKKIKVSKVDMGRSKGMVYKIAIGPFKTSEEAKKFKDDNVKYFGSNVIISQQKSF